MQSPKTEFSVGFQMENKVFFSFNFEIAEIIWIVSDSTSDSS